MNFWASLFFPQMLTVLVYNIQWKVHYYTEMYFVFSNQYDFILYEHNLYNREKIYHFLLESKNRWLILKFMWNADSVLNLRFHCIGN